MLAYLLQLSWRTAYCFWRCILKYNSECKEVNPSPDWLPHRLHPAPELNYLKSVTIPKSLSFEKSQFNRLSITFFSKTKDQTTSITTATACSNTQAQVRQNKGKSTRVSGNASDKATALVLQAPHAMQSCSYIYREDSSDRSPRGRHATATNSTQTTPYMLSLRMPICSCIYMLSSDSPPSSALQLGSQEMNSLWMQKKKISSNSGR